MLSPRHTMNSLAIRRRLMGLPPLSRRLLLGTLDVVFIPLALWLAFWLRTTAPLSPELLRTLWMFPVTWAVGLSLYATTGQYRGLTRYVSSSTFYAVALRNGATVVIVALVGAFLPVRQPPLSIWPLLWLLLTTLTGGVRFALRDLLLQASQSLQRQRLRVVIYGAGAAGAQLASALRLAGSHSVVAFVDEEPALWRRELDHLPILPPQRLAQFIEQQLIDQVLLAIPSLTRRRRRDIVETIQQLGIQVLQVPSIEEVASGHARITSLRPVPIEELLGRDAVPPDPSLLGLAVRDASVCVTGAGGSIGSELCRQILSLNANSLVLIENSEPALYAIHQELQRLCPESVKLIPILGSATDQCLLEHVFKDHQVQVVFHAAAYKHVPLVEANPLAGIANNIGSTMALCQAASVAHLQQVVLISTDKAVRPTNVMGASKRVAELVVQAHAQRAHDMKQLTRYSMVRFGNVLGSSGSVVPLFRRQIAAGGPITLTHTSIVRYFMTIPEAAQLVLQAAALAEGGDLFLLDMGEPVRIIDLAKQMIRLSGLTLRDAQNPDGDIAIKVTGLRPGEKLYEELLIEADSESTLHPLIFRAREQALDPEDLFSHLDALNAALARRDQSSVFSSLEQLVPEWRRVS